MDDHTSARCQVNLFTDIVAAVAAVLVVVDADLVTRMRTKSLNLMHGVLAIVAPSCA